ncbi:hypothetical protein ACOMHN_058872 [Nucella lapillus]
MEEDQGRASPPLPSKGAYNIDFDALDGSFNPFASKKPIGNSPPLPRKNPANSNAESLEHGAESVTESVPGGSDGPQASAPKEPSETPKKKKTKSSKRASALAENKGGEGGAADAMTASGDGLSLDGSLAADSAEKPVKTKKVKKPKSRPVSKNLEPKADGQGTPEKPQSPDELTANTTSAPAENTDSSTTTPQDTSAHEEAPAKPHHEKTPEQNQQHPENVQPEESPVVDNNLPQSPPSQADETTTPPSGKTDQQGEKSQQEEAGSQDTLAPPDTAEKRSQRHSDKSPSPSVGEEGAEGPSRKERKEGKVKKTKSKSKKSSRHSGVEGEMEGVDGLSEKDRDSKASPEANAHGDTSVAHDSAVDAAPGKAKHPASRVLEQQVRDDQSQPSARNHLPNDSEDDFYDAFDSPQCAPVTMDPTMQSYSDMNDSCTLFQSHDALAGLAWSQEDSTLLDEGAGEAAFAEDLTLVRTQSLESWAESEPPESRLLGTSYPQTDTNTSGCSDGSSDVNYTPAKSEASCKSSHEGAFQGDSDMADNHNTESVVKLVQVLKYSQSDWNKLRQELDLTFQAQLLAKEKEWGAKLADRDARLATLEEGSKKLRQTNEDMRTVMGEFEKTISQLQSEKEKTSNASQQSLQDVVKEKDQALEDLQSVETAFSDLHRRYEKTKGVVDGFKQNEEALKKCVQDMQNKLKKTEQKTQVIKEQAEEKLERATEEVENTKRSSTSEIARLEAALRKADLQVQSMESTLEQKVKENKELAAICDELIAKVH